MPSSSSRFPEPIETQAAAWTARIDCGVMTEEGYRELKAWLDADPRHAWCLAKYRLASGEMHRPPPPPAGHKPPPDRRAGRWDRIAVAGATLALAAGATFWFCQPGPNPPAPTVRNLTTQAGERQRLELPDGSVVQLNAGTSLAFEAIPGARWVRLIKGEALFTVVHDPARPFVVETAEGKVRDVGTIFDVRRDADRPLEVTVLEGAVAFERRGEAAVPVQPMRRLSLASGQPSVAVISGAEAEEAVAWRDGAAVFAGTPLPEALERVARYQGRRITADPSLAGLRLGGRFSLDDLDGFLAALQQALPVDVARDGDGSIRIVRRAEP